MWPLFFYQILKEKHVVHFFWAFYYYLSSLRFLLFSWLTYVLLCLFNKAVLHIITQMILNVLLRLTPIFLFESEINRKKLQKKNWTPRRCLHMCTSQSCRSWATALVNGHKTCFFRGSWCHMEVELLDIKMSSLHHSIDWKLLLLAYEFLWF